MKKNLKRSGIELMRERSVFLFYSFQIMFWVLNNSFNFWIRFSSSQGVSNFREGSEFFIRILVLILNPVIDGSLDQIRLQPRYLSSAHSNCYLFCMIDVTCASNHVREGRKEGTVLKKTWALSHLIFWSRDFGLLS